MRPVLLVGVLVVILVVSITFWWMTKANYTLENGTSYINNTVAPGQSSSDGNVVYLGNFTTQAACQNATTAKGGLSGYTWHDSTQGGYANQCYGVQSVKQRDAQNGHQSAYRT